MKRMGMIFLFGGILWLLSVIFAHPATFGVIDASEHKGLEMQSHDAPLHKVRATSKGHAGTAMSFETFRMLSTGMTRAEVLSRVGSPRHTFGKSRVWVYSATDNWIVQLTFSGERVIEIKWSRP